MRKVIFLFLFFIGLSACGQVGVPVAYENVDEENINVAVSDVSAQKVETTQFKEILLGDKKFYFEYPSLAQITENSSGGSIDYNGCVVNFGEKGSANLSSDSSLKRVDHDSGDGKFSVAWYRDNSLVAYDGARVVSPEPEFHFLYKADGKSDDSLCIDFVDGLIGSFTDKIFYTNEKFSFRVPVLADYKMENLPSGDGILMKKWVEVKSEDEDVKRPKNEQIAAGYKVEIAVLAYENLSEFSDVISYVSSKYSGYTMEFVDLGQFSAVYVDESSGTDAIRHFFLTKDGNVYEAYLKSPSIYYSRHKEEFDKFVSNIELF